MTPPALRILFLGTSPFAVPSLEALAKDPRFAVLGVITQPDRPVGRSKIITPPPVKIAAQALGLPIDQPENIRSHAQSSKLKAQSFDFLVVVSYGQILSQEILDFPSIAAVNVHASLLPHWRGASPIQHAILMGDSETGVTIQKMVQELDAGPILGQESTPIASEETLPSLHDRLATLGASLLVETIIAPLKPVEQEISGVTHCRKLSREDGIVDPATMTAEEIDRKVRALNPWPGVSFTTNGTTVKILEASLQCQPESVPLPCKDTTTLHLITVQPAGKKPMSGAAWERGR